MSTMVDYKALLKKYMKDIAMYEGTDYTYNYEMSDPDFTDEERSALLELSTQNKEEYPNG